MTPPLFEEERIEIRAVNLRVAQGARLILLCLVMESWQRWDGSIYGEGVALKTKEVDLATLEKSGIGRAVWRVASHATFHLHCLVLMDKWPGLVHMALEAHQILRGCRTQLTRLVRPVGIMAIAAAYQTLVDTVVERTGELLLRLQMAAIAKLRLLLAHQVLGFFRVMR